MSTAYSKEYIKSHPYRVWVYRGDGTKFIGHFKNAREAEKWRKAIKMRQPFGKAKPRKKHRRSSNSMGFPSWARF